MACPPRKHPERNTRNRVPLWKDYNKILNLVNVFVYPRNTITNANQELIKNNITNIDSVFFTHKHGDQVHGINDLRVFSLKNENKIPVVEVPIHNDEHCMEHIEKADPDLIVFGGTRIIRGQILEYGEARGGVLNSHPGLLPECRGSASPAWSVHENIKIGSSCHFCSTEIDAGDLVGKRVIPVRRGDNYHDLCYKTLVVASTLMVEAVRAYSEGNLDSKKRPQGQSPNPVFRYNPEIEQEAIRILERETYQHYVD